MKKVIGIATVLSICLISCFGVFADGIDYEVLDKLNRNGISVNDYVKYNEFGFDIDKFITNYKKNTLNGTLTFKNKTYKCYNISEYEIKTNLFNQVCKDYPYLNMAIYKNLNKSKDNNLVYEITTPEKLETMKQISEKLKWSK